MQKQLSNYRPHALVILIILTLTSLLTAFTFKDEDYETVMAEGNIITISSRWGEMGHIRMAMDFFGQTVMVWQDSGGKSYEIYGQIFDNNGRPKFTPFRVNKYRPEDQKYPSIAMDGVGNFIVVYQSYKQDGSEAGIFGQRYSYDRKLKNGTFRVNTYVMRNQMNPAIAINTDGKFVVTWVSERQDNTPRSIYAQQFDENGNKTGKEFRVNVQNSGSQDSPDVAIDDNGNFMIVWESRMKDSTNLYGQIFDWQGNPKSKTDMRLNIKTDLSQENPSVTLTGKGTFMTVWENETYDNALKMNLDNIKGQMFDKNGKKIGGEISVTSPFFGHQKNPALIKTSPSGMMVVWQEYSKKTDYKGWTVKAQAISNTPAKSGDVITLSAYSEDHEKTEPTIASDGKGDIGAAWLSKVKSTGMTSIDYKRGL